MESGETAEVPVIQLENVRQLGKIEDFFNEHQKRMTPENKAIFQRVIENREVSSYQKLIKIINGGEAVKTSTNDKQPIRNGNFNSSEICALMTRGRAKDAEWGEPAYTSSRKPITSACWVEPYVMKYRHDLSVGENLVEGHVFSILGPEYILTSGKLISTRRSRTGWDQKMVSKRQGLTVF